MLARLGRRTATALTLAAGLAVFGCGSDDNGGTNPGGGGGGGGAAVTGTWNATSFTALGTDFIAGGMGITFTFDGAGSYTFVVTGDTGNVFCDMATTCTDGGSYTADASTITLDPGTTDEAVLAYTIVGSTMTVTTTIEGVPIAATFVKV